MEQPAEKAELRRPTEKIKADRTGQTTGSASAASTPEPTAVDPTAVDMEGEALERLCFRNLLAVPGERLFFKDLDSRFLLASDSVLVDQAAGLTMADVRGKTDADFFSEEHAAAALADEQWVITSGQPIVGKVERETFRDRPDAWVSTTKLPLRDQQGRVIGTFGISRDVTAQVHAERALAHHALHDPVTGLANRLALTDRLTQALVPLERESGRLGLLFVDLDNFKDINDSLGHEVGDRVLMEVAQRLSKICRRGDTAARFGGDEFVLLCTALRHDDDIGALANRVVVSMAKPFQAGGTSLRVSASVGAVATSDASISANELIQRADMAMYEAKSAGRNGFRTYDPNRRSDALADRHFSAALRSAIDQRELFLMYQPLFALEDQALRGVEALVRWEHPERGVVAPCDFIPFAEEHGLIAAIDSFVFDEGCRQLAQWAAEGPELDGFTMAVNLSGRQLSDPTLVERIAASMEAHGTSPAHLCLEVTETALVGELDGAANTLAELSKLGVRLALDDFGTGYSTLAHVQRLNVDILKIDRSFVEQLGRSDRDKQIVAAITAMAHALGMSVVGEGIETDHQFRELASLGCDEGQGYLLARPLAPERVSELRQASASSQGTMVLLP